MLKNLYFLFFIALFALGCTSSNRTDQYHPLEVSDNNRYIMDQNGDPFFWLGDTGWLLFSKLNREEIELYLEDRRQKGFNVIQVMVLHTVYSINVYGDTALIDHNVATPRTTEGSDFNDSVQYDFWDHVDYAIDKAAEKNLFMGLVPVWGGNVSNGWVNNAQAEIYAAWLAERYKNRPNIIWLNGGDVMGSDSARVWKTIGNTLREIDTNHLITFHPRGRTQSSMWFHNEEWLDFNMIQSGHRRYDQDDTELCYGEDNWRYVKTDYNLTPVKPTLDGEPSYEQIPQGLHDTLQPCWKDNDVRRYAYWSVFSGACGFTYGHNAIMQFYKPGDTHRAYGVKHFWFDALDHPGGSQMIHLKNLMLSRPYFERVPDQLLIAGEQGSKYDYQVATRGENYIFVYTYNGRRISVRMGKIQGTRVSAQWYNPRDGSITPLGEYPNIGIVDFDPPGEKEDGNDWVLVLDSKM